VTERVIERKGYRVPLHELNEESEGEESNQVCNTTNGAESTVR
jgi:hypothetical protein